MSETDVIRDSLTRYVPDGFRDDDGVWHDGPHRVAALAALARLEAERDEAMALTDGDLRTAWRENVQTLTRTYGMVNADLRARAEAAEAERDEALALTEATFERDEAQGSVGPHYCRDCGASLDEVRTRITGVCPRHGVTSIVCGNPRCWCNEEPQKGDGRVIGEDGVVDWKQAAIGWRRRAQAAEERSRLLAEALREIDALLRTPAARSEIRRFARAALAGSVAPEPCPRGCVDTEGCGCAWNNAAPGDAA